MNVYVPILNGAKNKWEFPVFLGDGISLIGLSGEDYSNSVGDASDAIRGLVKKDVLSIRLKATGDRERVLSDLASIVFLLNTRSCGSPVDCPIAVSDEKSWLPASLPYGLQFRSRQRWKLDKLMNTSELAALASVIKCVYAQAPSARIAINRMLLSMYRVSDVDRIIDLAIAFESLITGTSEVSFKCALFNAFTSCGTPQLRMKAYEDIKALYDVRSKLVHGSLDAGNKNVLAITERIDELHKLCAKAIIAYIAFLADLADPVSKKLPGAGKIDESWSNKQLELVMGVEEI